MASRSRRPLDPVAPASGWYTGTVKVSATAIDDQFGFQARFGVDHGVQGAAGLVSIRDYGRGISEAEQERFMRSQGMISMKRRAKSIQGQCLVESGPGYGTVIRLTLPLDRATEAA